MAIREGTVADPQMIPMPAQVTLTSLAFKSCMEMLVNLILHGSKSFETVQGQKSIEDTLEIVDEALSRGMHTG